MPRYSPWEFVWPSEWNREELRGVICIVSGIFQPLPNEDTKYLITVFDTRGKEDTIIHTTFFENALIYDFTVLSNSTIH